MITDSRKLIVAALVSVTLLAALLFVADFKFPELSHADPVWLAVMLCAHLSMIVARSLMLSNLAPKTLRARWNWVRLAARHQLLFSILPAGVGDAGFPYLAKRTTSLPTAVALRMMAQFRLRDVIFVAIIGLAGMMFVGLPFLYGLSALVVAVPLLWFADEIADRFLRLVGAIAPRSRILVSLREAVRQKAPTARERLARTVLPMLAWSTSVAAVVAAFRAIGFQAGIGEALLLVAAVNIAGAIKISIAGLGVSEAGAAAALLAAGSTIEQAASVALVVRLLLLLSVIGASLVLELTVAIIRSQLKLIGASIR